jgi:hypothetical protein
MVKKKGKKDRKRWQCDKILVHLKEFGSCQLSPWGLIFLKSNFYEMVNYHGSFSIQGFYIFSCFLLVVQYVGLFFKFIKFSIVKLLQVSGSTKTSIECQL